MVNSKISSVMWFLVLALLRLSLAGLGLLKTGSQLVALLVLLSFSSAGHLGG